MSSDFLALVVLHLACANLSETRPLEPGEMRACTAIYQEVKLAFIPGVDLATYRALPLEDQGRINTKAYLRFVAWRSANPDLLSYLDRLARGDDPRRDAI